MINWLDKRSNVKKENARSENSNSADRKNKFKKKLVVLNNKYGGYGVDELIDTRHFFVFRYKHV